MSKTLKVSLVISTLIILIGSISLIYFKTRDNEKTNSNTNYSEGLDNVDDNLNTETFEEELETETNKEETISNETKVEKKSENKTEEKSNEVRNDEPQNNNQVEQEEQEETLIDIPDPINPTENGSNLENDEEYIRILNSCEFTTYSDCQSASEKIAAELAFDNNVRNTACESFAYKGKIVGYRVQIFFNDGTWKYNN